ncbi:MAG: hypothetical protein ACRDJG_08280 [Actinomycetota bacterium]
MGVILKEEYVCDYCGKTISGSDVLVGRLALRRQGARGLGKEFGLALHDACSGKLTAHASPVTRQRRSSAEARQSKAEK